MHRGLTKVLHILCQPRTENFSRNELGQTPHSPKRSVFVFFANVANYGRPLIAEIFVRTQWWSTFNFLQIVSRKLLTNCFVRIKISYSSVRDLSYALNFHTARTVSHTLLYVHGFRMLLNFVLSAKSTKSTKLRQDPPLDLRFWSFLTFLHHGIEEVERHRQWKFHQNIQRRSWSNVPPKLLACIRFLYKVVHKNGRPRKFNRTREIEFHFFIAWTIFM